MEVVMDAFLHQVGISESMEVVVSATVRVNATRAMMDAVLRCQAHLHPRGDVVLRPNVAVVGLNITRQ